MYASSGNIKYYEVIGKVLVSNMDESVPVLKSCHYRNTYVIEEKNQSCSGIHQTYQCYSYSESSDHLLVLEVTVGSPLQGNCLICILQTVAVLFHLT